MNNNIYNAKNREQRLQHAFAHNKLMQSLYSDEIHQSINNSKIYQDINPIQETNIPTQKFTNKDSVSALFENCNHNERICILNFASYKYPGGGYMSGSSAQEEALCHESTLYEVISNEKFNDYYNWNNQNLNNSMYLNRAIYSPNILFIRDKVIITKH